MKAANLKAMRSAEDKVFKHIWSSVYPTHRNSDYTKIVYAIRQGANAPGKLPLDLAAKLLVPWVEYVTAEIEGDGDAFLFSDSDILDVAYAVAERLLDELRKKGALPAKGMREGKVPAKKADDESEDTTENTGKSFKQFRKQLDEQVYTVATKTKVLDEGAVKAAMEDWMYSLPKAVIAEITRKYASKLKAAEITGLSKGDPVRKALIALLDKHKVPPALGDTSRDSDIFALETMFNSFFGESVEISEAVNIGTNAYEIQKSGSNWEVWKLSYSQGSVRFPDGRKGTKLRGDFKSRDEAMAYAKKDAGVKESVELEEAHFKKVGVSPDGKPVYSMNGKYYVVSYSVMAKETAIFASDSKGNVANYRDLWMGSGFVSPDTAMKELEKSLTK